MPTPSTKQPKAEGFKPGKETNRYRIEGAKAAKERIGLTTEPFEGTVDSVDDKRMEPTFFFDGTKTLRFDDKASLVYYLRKKGAAEGLIHFVQQEGHQEGMVHAAKRFLGEKISLGMTGYGFLQAPPYTTNDVRFELRDGRLLLTESVQINAVILQKGDHAGHYLTMQKGRPVRFEVQDDPNGKGKEISVNGGQFKPFDDAAKKQYLGKIVDLEVTYVIEPRGDKYDASIYDTAITRHSRALSQTLLPDTKGMRTKMHDFGFAVGVGGKNVSRKSLAKKLTSNAVLYEAPRLRTLKGDQLKPLDFQPRYSGKNSELSERDSNRSGTGINQVYFEDQYGQTFQMSSYAQLAEALEAQDANPALIKFVKEQFNQIGTAYSLSQYLVKHAGENDFSFGAQTSPRVTAVKLDTNGNLLFLERIMVYEINDINTAAQYHNTNDADHPIFAAEAVYQIMPSNDDPARPYTATVEQVTFGEYDSLICRQVLPQTEGVIARVSAALGNLARRFAGPLTEENDSSIFNLRESQAKPWETRHQLEMMDALKRTGSDASARSEAASVASSSASTGWNPDGTRKSVESDDDSGVGLSDDESDDEEQEQVVRHTAQ